MNIDKYKASHKIAILNKQTSPLSILVCSEESDLFLLDVIKYQKQSGKIVSDFMITKNDLPQMINKWQKDGYVMIRRTA